ENNDIARNYFMLCFQTVKHSIHGKSLRRVNFILLMFSISYNLCGNCCLGVEYRIGTKKDDITRMQADASDLDWICRDKTKYTTALMLKPLTIAMDIITFPAQIIFFIVILSITGGGP
ncbi:MAG: hypothetical protein V2B20_01260, partial [Pseudomonadota bacterium]